MFLERFKEVENFTITKLPLGGSKINTLVTSNDITFVLALLNKSSRIKYK